MHLLHTPVMVDAPVDAPLLAAAIVAYLLLLVVAWALLYAYGRGVV